MDKNLILQCVELSELMTLFQNTLKEEISPIKEEIRKNQSVVLLTREETAKLLKIDQSTLWDWTRKGKLQSYGIASRRYYKKHEVLESIKPLNR